jgi:hypothetical protein
VFDAGAPGRLVVGRVDEDVAARVETPAVPGQVGQVPGGAFDGPAFDQP